MNQLWVFNELVSDCSGLLVFDFLKISAVLGGRGKLLTTGDARNLEDCAKLDDGVSLMSGAHRGCHCHKTEKF